MLNDNVLSGVEGNIGGYVRAHLDAAYTLHFLFKALPEQLLLADILRRSVAFVNAAVLVFNKGKYGLFPAAGIQVARNVKIAYFLTDNCLALMNAAKHIQILIGILGMDKALLDIVPRS